ncbi:MAG TPA: alpha/beta hydrolase [Pseudonocardia sp.]|nr:alpha/beta hydrolase [Pseudonocardia sp.]
MADTRLVSLGQHRSAVRVSGSGSPAVVFLSSLGGAHEEWDGVVTRLAPLTTCVTYGRPALGGSDGLPRELTDEPLTATWAAGQLHALLAALELEPPYVMVTGSIGGWVGDRFVAAWPAEVAGIVLIDPSGLTDFPGLDEPPETAIDWVDGGIRFARELSRIELAGAVPASAPPRSVVLSSAHGRWLRNSPHPWHRPLTLEEVEQHWRRMQRDWADRFGACHVIAHQAGHSVHGEAPDLAAHVVRAVFEAARRDDRVRLEESELDDVGARLCSEHG